MNAHLLGWVIAAAIWASLLSAVTNIVPTAGTLAGAGILLMPLTLAVVAMRRLRGLGVYWSVCGLIAAMAISAAWYDADQLRCLFFYRYDASLLLVWAPLLLLPLADTMPAALDPEKYVRPWALWCLLVIGAAWIVISLEPLIIPLLRLSGAYPFHALNAAGGALAMMVALLLAQVWPPARTNWWWFVLAGLVLLLVGTWSRGSMLGLACGVAIWWTRRRGWRWLAPMMLAIAIIGTGWSIMTGRGHASEVPESSTVAPSERKAWNVAVRRAVLWPRAWDGFLSAPLFGHGLGSYNDRPPDPAYMAFGPGLTARFYGRPEHVAIFDDAHAHHSYLHLLYETGICGLTLSVLLLWALLRSLTPHLGRDRLADGLHIALWTIIFVSFTERGLAAPAIVLPWTTWYVWWFGARRCVAQRGALTGKTSADVASSLNVGDKACTNTQ